MPDKIRVLLVDDDEDDFIITRDIIHDIPGRQYYLLDWTASFNEALQTHQQKQHDVYLVDFRLGAHDGLELITTAVEEGYIAPFILLTGQSDRETDERPCGPGRRITW